MKIELYQLLNKFYEYHTVSLVFSHLCFWSGNFFLIVPFPFFITFNEEVVQIWSYDITLSIWELFFKYPFFLKQIKIELVKQE